MQRSLLLALSAFVLTAASCGVGSAAESPPPSQQIKDQFRSQVLGTFDEPWGAAIAPGTELLFITERRGSVKIQDLKSGRLATLTGLPKVDYGGQGGLGDIAFVPAETGPTFKQRTIYLSWIEADAGGDKRGAVVGRGTVRCGVADECAVENLQVIWRQDPKVTGRGHFSHRLAISPDGKYLYVASGDRQKFTPAQDLSDNLGKVLRLKLDGTPAAGNPFASQGATSAQIWTYGHRNILGLQFDTKGQLWELEHGPKGGDELNLVKPGQNYGWPLVSDGDHYDGKVIPRHITRPDLAAPAISWNPVIAPGDFIFYSGKLWPQWKGQALIAGLGSKGLVRVRIDGPKATEQARYPLGKRIREMQEAADGALLVLEDGPGGRLLRLTPP